MQTFEIHDLFFLNDTIISFSNLKMACKSMAYKNYTIQLWNFCLHVFIEIKISYDASETLSFWAKKLDHQFMFAWIIQLSGAGNVNFPLHGPMRIL